MSLTPGNAVIAAVARALKAAHLPPMDERGCILWPRAIGKDGYGRVAINGRILLAHRVAYEAARGPIPQGLQIDHLCRVRACVNPAHLEVVTSRVNSLRGVGPAAINALRTHCPRGHAYTPENTYWRGRSRACRACRHESNRSFRQSARGREVDRARYRRRMADPAFAERERLRNRERMRRLAK